MFQVREHQHKGPEVGHPPVCSGNGSAYVTSVASVDEEKSKTVAGLWEVLRFW